MLNEQSEKQSFPNTTQNWIGLGKLVNTYNFIAPLFLHCTNSIKDQLRPWQLVPVPKLQLLAFAVESFWHLALTTSTMEILRVARLGWFPRPAKLPLHGRWHQTWQMCNSPWNFKPTIGKAELPKINRKLDCRAISRADPNPLSTGWLLGQIKRNFNPGPREASIGINLPEPLGCQPSKQSKPSRKPFQPTLWECHCMIASTLHAAFWCVETSAKAFNYCSSIEHDYYLQTAGFLCTPAISTQDALIEVGELFRLWPAVIAALPSLEPPQLFNIRHN